MSQEKENVPLSKVLELKRSGASKENIYSDLRKERFSNNQISDALSQADIKSEVNNNEVPSSLLMDAPSPSSTSESFPIESESSPIPRITPSTEVFAPMPAERASYDSMEQMAESIIKEKWQELTRSTGDIKTWKEKIDMDIQGVKQELLRTQERFENLQKALVSKIKDYDTSVTNVTTEMKALEKVLEKIMEPLSRNIKDLESVTKKLKK